MSGRFDSQLRTQGIPREIQKSFPVYYRGEFLCQQRVDIIVNGQVLLQIKAVDRLAAIHHAQAMSYLRLTGCALPSSLINFNVTMLPQGLRRIVL